MLRLQRSSFWLLINQLTTLSPIWSLWITLRRWKKISRCLTWFYSQNPSKSPSRLQETKLGQFTHHLKVMKPQKNQTFRYLNFPTKVVRMFIRLLDKVWWVWNLLCRRNIIRWLSIGNLPWTLPVSQRPCYHRQEDPLSTSFPINSLGRPWWAQLMTSCLATPYSTQNYPRTGT